MDTLTFVAELVRALAWPMSLLFLTFMLRKPIRELIPLLRKLKYKEIELEFSREIAQLKSRAIGPSERLETLKLPPKERKVLAKPQSDALAAKHKELLRMVGFSTRVAVMEAWLEVESAAVEVASSFWGQSASNVMRDFPRLGEYLLQCDVINQTQFEAFNRLRSLRNKAAHAVELNLSEADAIGYVDLAMALVEAIRGRPDLTAQSP